MNSGDGGDQQQDAMSHEQGGPNAIALTGILDKAKFSAEGEADGISIRIQGTVGADGVIEAIAEILLDESVGSQVQLARSADQDQYSRPTSGLHQSSVQDPPPTWSGHEPPVAPSGWGAGHLGPAMQPPPPMRSGHGPPMAPSGWDAGHLGPAMQGPPPVWRGYGPPMAPSGWEAGHLGPAMQGPPPDWRGYGPPMTPSGWRTSHHGSAIRGPLPMWHGHGPPTAPSGWSAGHRGPSMQRPPLGRGGYGSAFSDESDEPYSLQDNR